MHSGNLGWGRHWWWDCSSNIIHLKLNYDFINPNSLKSKRQEPQKTEGGTANVPGDITGEEEPELWVWFISDTRGHSQGRSARTGGDHQSPTWVFSPRQTWFFDSFLWLPARAAARQPKAKNSPREETQKILGILGIIENILLCLFLLEVIPRDAKGSVWGQE